MVRGLNDMYMENYREHGSPSSYGKRGRFVAPRTVEVTLADGPHVKCGRERIVSTGTRAGWRQFPDLGKRSRSRISRSELDEIPEPLACCRWGYVGVEISQAMRRFWQQVTNGRSQRAADVPKKTRTYARALRGLLADEGIDILPECHESNKCRAMWRLVSVVVEQNGIEKVQKGSHVLVATGRKSDTEGLGLELTGVELTDRGIHRGQQRLQTTAPGVWAIGEVAGSPHFTHISVDDFRVVHAI